MLPLILIKNIKIQHVANCWTGVINVTIVAIVTRSFNLELNG